MRTNLLRARLRERGFAYAEVLLSVALLGILLVPAMQALNEGVGGGGVASSLATEQLGLRSKMEEVLGKPFGELYAQTYLPGGNTTTSVSATLSDAVGAPKRRVVVLYRFDATTNALSTGDTGLVFVRVAFEAESSLHTLATTAGRWW